MTCPASRKAEELGATIKHGINWSWADGFATEDLASEFVQWLDDNGYEHRGGYPHDGKVDVRFR